MPGPSGCVVLVPSPQSMTTVCVSSGSGFVNVPDSVTDCPSGIDDWSVERTRADGPKLTTPTETDPVVPSAAVTVMVRGPGGRRLVIVNCLTPPSWGENEAFVGRTARGSSLVNVTGPAKVPSNFPFGSRAVTVTVNASPSLTVAGAETSKWLVTGVTTTVA